MCQTIVINKGEKEIETPREFKEHFGYYPIAFEGCTKESINSDKWEDFCLCSCNIDETLKAHRIDYKWDGSDYYIGMLDQLKGDFYIR